MSAPGRPRVSRRRCSIADEEEARRRAFLLGVDAEAWVADALLADGWSVLARNWMGEGGELDLVVLRDGKLRVVEVKAREAEDPLGDEAITATKLARLRRAAAAYVHLHPDGWDEVAFLVAWVDTTVRPWSIRWLDDAFDGPP